MLVTIECLIKKIRMNGGKTAPLVANAFDKMNTELKMLRAQMEASTSHEIFWEAANECRKAGEELSAARHATGFITREELDGQLKRSDFETLLWCAATAVATATGVLLAVNYG